MADTFRDDVETLIANTFTMLKKKKSPQNTEILSVIRFDCGDVADLLTEYLRFLKSRKIFCIECRLCGGYFLAKSRNTQYYCKECKVLHDEFIHTSAAMLWEYEESGSEELENEIYAYIEKVKSMRATMEGRAANTNNSIM